MPCFVESDADEGGGAFCKHCLELWKFADDKRGLSFGKTKDAGGVGGV